MTDRSGPGGAIGAVKEPFSRNESVQRAASSSQHAHSVVEGLVVENGNVLLSKLTEESYGAYAQSPP